jgi:hypothetical protein
MENHAILIVEDEPLIALGIHAALSATDHSKADCQRSTFGQARTR